MPEVIPPRYRGVSDQRLQTRGGERWPGISLAAEMRWKGPAVQAAKPPAPATLARRTLTTRAGACQRRASGSGPRRKVSSTTGEALDFRGPLRSKPINTARGTPWELADLRRVLSMLCKKPAAGTFGIGMPRCREANEARGSIRTRSGVPRALGFNSRRRHQELQAAPGA